MRAGCGATPFPPLSRRPRSSIYAGQTFSSCLAVINASNFVLNDVTIQAELQAGNSRRKLENAAEGGRAPSTEALGVGATLSMVVRERLPDSGAHVSVAAAQASIARLRPSPPAPQAPRGCGAQVPQDGRPCGRAQGVQVHSQAATADVVPRGHPPCSCSSRGICHSPQQPLPSLTDAPAPLVPQDGRALVEAQVRNATGSDLSILDTRFAAEAGWDAAPVHSDTGLPGGQRAAHPSGAEDGSPWDALDASLDALALPYSASRAARLPSLRKGELWQCAFFLTPRGDGSGPAPGTAGQAQPLGQLRVSYAGPGGERGDVVGNSVTRHPRPHAKTRLLLHAPPSAVLGTVLQCKVEVRNDAQAPARLRLEVRRHLLGDALCAVGKSAFDLGTVPARGATSHMLQLVASLAGMHAISGVVVVDSAGNEAGPAHVPSIVVELAPA